MILYKVDSFLKKINVQKIFTPCFARCWRTLTLNYAENLLNGNVWSYRFARSRRTFANASQNADNWCFDTDEVSNLSGIFNVSACRYGAPAFISFPHFYLADPYYTRQVDGLQPDKDLHQFRIDLEPVNHEFSKEPLPFSLSVMLVFQCLCLIYV